MINWDSYGVEADSEVTDEMVMKVEAMLGVSFPKAYIDLVKFNDEAIFEIGSFEYKNTTTCISEFFKFTDKEEQYSILWYKNPNRIDIPNNFIPIARDAGDYLICLDFNLESVPVKLFVPGENLVFDVANSFELFISILEE